MQARPRCGPVHSGAPAELFVGFIRARPSGCPVHFGSLGSP